MVGWQTYNVQGVLVPVTLFNTLDEAKTFAVESGKHEQFPFKRAVFNFSPFYSWGVWKGNECYPYAVTLGDKYIAQASLKLGKSVFEVYDGITEHLTDPFKKNSYL
jgi:hypothetical protein